MTVERAATAEKIKKARLVAVVRGAPEDKALKILDALAEGGVTAAEFAFEHTGLEAIEKNARLIKRACARFGSSLLIGCGTALSVEEVQAARAAGACFAVSPSTIPEVISAAAALDMAVMPGAMTPTEAEAAWRAGADIVKIFPAGTLGASYIKALKGPLGHIPMFAVGGVSLEETPLYLDAGACGLGLSTSLIPPDAAARGDAAAIIKRARLYLDAIRRWEEARGGR